MAGIAIGSHGKLVVPVGPELGAATLAVGRLVDRLHYEALAGSPLDSLPLSLRHRRLRQARPICVGAGAARYKGASSGCWRELARQSSSPSVHVVRLVSTYSLAYA